MCALYKKSLELYSKKIEKESSSSLYGRVLLNEYEELKSIEGEIPSFNNVDLEKCAESVLKEVGGEGTNGVVGWVQKIVNRNYSLH